MGLVCQPIGTGRGEDDTKQVQALTLCFLRDTLAESLDERKSVNAIIDAIKHYIEGH